jgi:hypothetical protein
LFCSQLGVIEDHPTVLKKIWADPVWSKVIATLILAAGGGIAAYFVGWWPGIAAIVSKIISLVVASTLVSNWLLVPVCLMALFGVTIFFVRLYHHPARPDWRNYREDTFFDMVWRWRYNAYNNAIMDLTSFCPRCDTQLLQVHNSSMPYHPYRTVYHCRFCDSQTEISKNVNDILTTISLQIERNVRQIVR